jgi:hypothetical protein
MKLWNSAPALVGVGALLAASVLLFVPQLTQHRLVGELLGLAGFAASLSAGYLGYRRRGVFGYVGIVSGLIAFVALSGQYVRG